MRILIVNKHYEDVIGGSEIQCDIIARHLFRFGHDVIYGAVKSRRNSYNSLYRVVPIRKLHPWSLLTVIRETAPHLVYWRYNKKSLLAAGILSRICGCKLVFSISHVNDITRWAYKPSNVFKQMQQMLSSRLNYLGYLFLHGVVTLRRDFLVALPFARWRNTKRILIYDCMEPQESGEFAWDKPYVVWVSSIKKSKNPEMYVKTAERSTHLPVDFLMVGRIHDPTYSYLENADQLPPNLHYLGLQEPSRVDAIIKGSLFLVHTCDPEGFSNNFIQAWLLSKPTVSLFFDPDGTIEAQQIGYRSGTLEQMCRDIEHLLENDGLRKDMGERAKSFAQQWFLPEKNVRKLEQFFQEVLSS